ncbi:TraI domain-containing protein [Variovorax sp. ZS18.2.2]|nr:TraI domain-containing protein [Variovorax sp. ZS18.2.2]
MATTAPEVAGSAEGWLRVLDAEQLLRCIQADKAIGEIWRQSRLSSEVWERDCLPALRNYAEFVQLAPASESHHHAHVGGLLSHTMEMVLAAMTWRNGHFLPAGKPIEAIDAQRDEWTYVVFFAALLHDVAKPMTDLRLSWRSTDMADALRWVPMAGSLSEVSRSRRNPEYLVEFAPKSQRDYSAHSRLAMMLLPRIAPASALSFMARQPEAFDALNRYLSGQDTESLLARIVRKADQASTQRALLTGSKARFSTSNSVPLVDLLMQAIGSMLRAGTSLPLNRTGAAGWIHNGSMWFVAKRLADAVRAWIKTHAPDEAVPGETKNDRFFDTWQEYGCIEPNPVSGQAIWYVTVHGRGAEESGATDDDASGGEDDGDSGSTDLAQGAYSHSLSMLRFPLSKLFDNPAAYPPAMRGHIEVHAKRGKADAEEGETAGIGADTGADISTAESAAKQAMLVSASRSGKNKDAAAGGSGAMATTPQRPPTLPPAHEDAAGQTSHAGKLAKPSRPTSAPGSKAAAEHPTDALRAPAFNKPATAPRPARQAQEAAPSPRAANAAPAAKNFSASMSGALESAVLDDDVAYLVDVDPSDARPGSSDHRHALVNPDSQTRAAGKTQPGGRAAKRVPASGSTVRVSSLKTSQESAALVETVPAPRRSAAIAGEAIRTQPDPVAGSGSAQEEKDDDEVMRQVAGHDKGGFTKPIFASSPAMKRSLIFEGAPSMSARTRATAGSSRRAETTRHETDHHVDTVTSVGTRDPHMQPSPSGQDASPAPVMLVPKLPKIRSHGVDGKKAEPSEVALDFMRWLQAGLGNRELKYNETGAAVHFTPEGMALVSPIIFKLFAATEVDDPEIDKRSMLVQREVIKAGWHMSGPSNTNIIRYEIVGRGGVTKGRLSTVVLVEPERWVLPVPPSNSALQLN